MNTQYYAIAYAYSSSATPRSYIYIIYPRHRSTHGRISGEMETLRLLTTSTVVDPKQLHKIYSEVVSLCAKMGLELEALSR